MWNSEAPGIPQNSPLYGSHPVYFDHRGDKGTHGVFLLNANGMDIKISTDDKGQFLEYNTIGGVLDLYFLAGSKPTDVSRQYADVVGYSAMYPYWTFGFQQCKYGYWDVNMVAEVVGNYSSAGIPLEVMWTDIDYMDLRQDFTVDKDRFPLEKMRELVETLHKRDQKYILILDPGVHAANNYETYSSGHDQDVFLKHADGSDYLGVQWPGVVAWPDWFAPNTLSWWTNEFTKFFNPDTGINIDGIWVDMNEGSNFCGDISCNPTKYAAENGVPPIPVNSPRPNTGRVIPGFPDSFQPSSSSRKVKARAAEPELQTRNAPQFGQSKGTLGRPNILEPPYKIRGKYNQLSDKTIWVNTTNYDGTLQYDTHNLYGSMMADATNAAMLKRRDSVRPVVMTRSTFAGIGRKATHWFGDNASIWEHYRTSIRQMLSFVAMHQMPMVGSDVCGFNQDAEETMCARWAMIGAFQPFYRNHAADNARFQEFYQWQSVTDAAKKAIDTRYKLMDYAYTALYYQTKEGTPMINPVFYLYPGDSATFGIQHQWFYGDALLVSPVVDDFADKVDFYLPKDIWYDYWTHERIDSPGETTSRSGLKTNEIPVHIRGGTIIPQRVNSANTTKLLRKEDFIILVAPGADGKASGRLYLDDGESIEQPSITEIKFNWESNKLTTSGSFNYAGSNGESTTVTKVVVLGGEGNDREQEGNWNMNGDFSVAFTD
jgi:alpha-glucosidase